MNNWTRLLLASVLATAMTGCGGDSIHLPYRESFSDGCHRWSTQNDHLLKVECRGGSYHVLVRDARNPQLFTVPVRADVVKIEVDMRLTTGPPPLQYGIGCFRSDHSGNWFTVAPRTGYQIASYEEQPGLHKATVDVIAHTDQGASDASSYRITALCTSGRPGSAGSSPVIAMWINGKLVLNAADPATIAATAVGQELGEISHVGVIVVPSAPRSDVQFDNFAVHKGSASAALASAH